MKHSKGLSLSSLKKKQTLVIVGASVLVLAIAGTIAFNSDIISFANIFGLASDEMEFVEVFDSPDDWQPCQTYPKTAVVTNKNSDDRYVRMKINEYWRVKNSQTSVDDHETTDLPLTWTDGGTTKHFAIINTQNEDKWELRDDDWYYYTTALAPNETTLSYLESVTFNCEVNTVGEIRYSIDGKASEDVPSEYSEASYHVYVTFQTSSVEYENPKHEADCDGDLLYDAVACQTNGPDDNLNFREGVSRELGNGNGVNTLSAHQNDNYPVYYFRGEVDNNFVIIGNNCWKILRTTGTGGVKLIYGYEAVNNNTQCIDFSTTSYPAFAALDITYGSTAVARANDGFAPHLAGYMYDSTIVKNDVSPSGRDYLAGSDVAWDGSQYTLQNTTTITSNSYTQDRLKYRYYCPDFVSTSCTTVAYMLDYSYYMHNRYILHDGMKYEDAVHNNVTDSPAKTALDSWYASNLTSYTNLFEDTVFCNDRTYNEEQLAGGEEMDYMFFDVKYRNWYTYQHEEEFGPSVDCNDKRDAFTVSEGYGNGKLTYPVGMITADEVTLAGIQRDGSYQTGNKNFLYTMINTPGCTWTMSPFRFLYEEFAYCTYLYEKSWTVANNPGGRVQPVVSVKKGTTFSSGDGKASSPYIIRLP